MKTRLAILLVLILNLSFQLSWAQQADTDSDDSANNNNTFVLKNFDAQSFLICQYLVSSSCSDSQTYQAARACINSLKPEPSCQPFVAFAKHEDILPRDKIDQYKIYDPINVFVLHLVRWGANYAGDYYLIDKNGSVINTTAISDKVDITDDKLYPLIANKFPQVKLFGSVGEMPKLMQLPNGNYGLVLRYELHDGCHACALAGYANIVYEFTPAGDFRSIMLLSLEPAQQNS